MSDQSDTPEVDPEDIKAAEKAAGIETVPEGAEDLPPETPPQEPTEAEQKPARANQTPAYTYQGAEIISG